MCRAFAERIARLPWLLAQIAIFVKVELPVRKARTGRGDPTSDLAIQHRRKPGAWQPRRTISLCNYLKTFM
jgi:hypothetical protein